MWKILFNKVSLGLILAGALILSVAGMKPVFAQYDWDNGFFTPGSALMAQWGLWLVFIIAGIVVAIILLYFIAGVKAAAAPALKKIKGE